MGFEPTKPCSLLVFETSAFNRTQPHFLEDTVGFEPTEPFGPHAFQACPLNHSGKCPGASYGTRTRGLRLDRAAITPTDPTKLVAEGGIEPPTQGYEPSEIPFLHSAW